MMRVRAASLTSLDCRIRELRVAPAPSRARHGA